MIAAWMLRTVAVGMLLGLAALTGDAIARAFRCPRRWLWLASLVTSLVLPALALWRPAYVPELLANAGWWPWAPRPVLAAFLGELRVVGLAPSPVGDADRLSLILGLAWAAASLAMLAVMGWSLLRLVAVRERCVVARMHGMRVLVSPDQGPAVLGVIRPEVVLPRWVVDAPAEDSRLIVHHEREHIDGGDVRLLLLATLAVALMPWNPALWWQHRRLRLAVETDCDARVLALGVDRRAYGMVLLRTAAGPPLLPMSVAAWARPSSQLHERIMAMTTPSPKHPRLLALPLAGLVIGILAVACDTAKPDGAGAVPPDLPTANRAADTGPAYTVAQLDAKPRLSNRDEIASVMERLYPRQLQDAGIGGTVSTQFVIRPDGTVDMSTVKVLKSSNDQLTTPSIETIESFKFSPGTYRGAPVRVIAELPITWQPAG
jgi:bla regulator protein BlaR1